MGSLLGLAQFSHFTFEICHSELCGMFCIPRNGIFGHIDKARGGYFENLSSRYNHLCGGDYSGI